jgi:cytochrome c553
MRRGPPPAILAGDARPWQAPWRLDQGDDVMNAATFRLMLLATLAGTFGPAAAAPDPDAGRAKAEAACAACHGALGISVSDTIPNLAGQKPRYLETQLKALKSGARKNDVMHAIASQLSDDDIANLAAHFARQKGPDGTGAKSPMLAALEAVRMAFPATYREGFVRYHTIDFPATGQVRHYFANPAAVQAAREGRPLPDGSFLLVEVHAARRGADGKPATGPDGFFVADKLLFYTAMAREAGWGAALPENLRNEDWNYAVFTTDGAPRPGVNQAECLACHKPLDKTSFTFTVRQLAEAAARK